MHAGSDDQLGRSIWQLYASWLPDSEAITDIYLPLR